MPARGMASRKASRLLLSIAAPAVVLTVVFPAFAAGGGRERYRNDEPGQLSVDDATRTRPLRISVDVVLGFGQSTVAQLAQPINGIIVPRTVLDYRHVFVESWLFGVSYDFGRGIGLALRAPFSYMSFASDNFRIATSALGNVELAPSYRHQVDDRTSMLFALGLTAPTAQGVAPSSDPAAKLDQNDTNRYFVQHASSATRGLESDAWYAFHRFGVTPSVAVELRPFSAPVTLTPHAKVELLFDTGGDATHKVASDGVLGLSAAWRPTELLTVSLRAFGVMPLAGRDDHRLALVVAPDVRAEGRRFFAGAGLVVPILGPTTDPRFTGIHLLVGVKF